MQIKGCMGVTPTGILAIQYKHVIRDVPKQVDNSGGNIMVQTL